MSYDVVLAQISACLAFFLILSWLGAHSFSYGYKQLSLLYTRDEAPLFNLTFRLAAPIVYLILLSALLYSLRLDRFVDRIYMVIVYYFAFRILFNVGMGYGRLLNWGREVFLAVVCTSASYYVYKNLIISRTFLFPNFTTVANEVWIGIAIFLYSVGNKVHVGSKASIERKAGYLRNQFLKLRERYDRIITGTTNDPHLQALTYAVMIYENFNRPSAVRALERFALRVSGPRTIGVMQIRTDRNISDALSVRKGVKKIVSDWDTAVKNDLGPTMERYSRETNIERRRKIALSDLFRRVIAKFNGGSAYGSEISYLYTDIIRQFYPSVKDNILEPWRDV